MKTDFHYFWGRQDFLSQWYPCTFKDQHYTYNCAEQFMMAFKAITFQDDKAWNAIMRTADPADQKNLGRQVRNFDAKIWDEKCQAVVYYGNQLKFNQNPDLLKQLLETKGEIVEASPYDRIWGIGLSADDPRAWNKNTWLGSNWLGHVLTLLRGEL